MKFKYLLQSAAIPVLGLAFSGVTHAQTSIETDQTTTVRTSTVNEGSPDDVTITTAATLSPESGTALIIDSSNDVVNSGTIIFTDVDDAIGIEIQGGNTGSLTQNGTISVGEDYTAADLDDDGIVDEPFAQGENRTGILISGASPFVGSISTVSGSSMFVEGNNSYGIRLMEATSLNGALNLGGGVRVTGDNGRAVSLEGDLNGDFTNSGTLVVRGEGSSTLVTSGDISGRFTNSGTIENSGYRFITRPAAAGRALLDSDDFLQANAAVQINGDIDNGILLSQVTTTTTADDGTETTVVSAISNIDQYGSAPAILIDGQGSPIAIGRVATITDASDPDYAEEEQYAFVNQGSIDAAGIYNDVNATTIEIRDAILATGINNAGTMQSTAFRSGDDGTADVAGSTGLARVIVIGDGAIASGITNSGLILAQVSEAIDEIYVDLDNPIAPRQIEAVTIDIEAGGSLASLINNNTISSVIGGRDGQAIAIRDRSGTLTTIVNTGSISAIAATSDAQGNEATSFETVAFDLSANTTGVSITQELVSDTSDATPNILGDVLLGSGDDTVNIEAGTLVGALSFGSGSDSLALSGGSIYTGALTNSGALDINVSGGSYLGLTQATPIPTRNVSFDGESVLQPIVDGQTGLASTLDATGNISLANGATISPTILNIFNTPSQSFTLLDAAGTLTIGGTLDSLNEGLSPLLFNVNYNLDPTDPNALVLTLDLRSSQELGLDNVQAASFDTTIEALQNNTGLANAFSGITDQATLNSAINQMLPEFAAAARQFVAANVDGAVGAVGTHLDNARMSQDKPGGVWIEEFAYFADRELSGLSEQYRGYGFGFTGGADTAIGPFHSVGLNVGFASTEIEDVIGFDEPLDVITLLGGAYLGYSRGALGIEAYAGGGYNDFEQQRNISIGSFTDTSKADWSGTHYNASLRAGYDINISERFWARPTASLDYLSLSENGYTEDGATGIALTVDDRTSELGGATAMLNFGANFNGRRTWMRPSFRVGYRHEFMNDGVVTNYGFTGLTQSSQLVSSEFPDSAVIVGFSFAAGSPFSSVGFDFDSDIRDGFIRHTGRIVLRLIF